ncbi:unnamed protein product [Rotaria magnacalcarata]|uniref:Uncharacterized protein n=1 Tax=Rotaria magnacalcarata TaxID=392030 RepID=A0A816KCG3_9BILA|nr:unnamed protein product [Rotaria magnacalcarata]CAF1611422.1 unnamed protein product [Rotaria magnacalcarata]CAF1913518.1 unnamed protein product [Rotaria magnacalcarata]CAF4242088.1 unnamed protein product [Rotaria magnacalcarata]CAF5149117.1 unnamed protein product [Rotaria magnacalcarata]
MAVVDEPRLLNRFSGLQTFVSNPFNGSSNGSRFVATWFRYSHASIVEKAELVAKGIEAEGIRIDQVSDAVSLATELRKVKHESWDILMTCCVNLYAREAFLYRLVNQVLSSNDTSRLETLGPFCWFLHNIV